MLVLRIIPKPGKREVQVYGDPGPVNKGNMPGVWLMAGPETTTRSYPESIFLKLLASWQMPRVGGLLLDSTPQSVKSCKMHSIAFHSQLVWSIPFPERWY